MRSALYYACDHEVCSTPLDPADTAVELEHLGLNLRACLHLVETSLCLTARPLPWRSLSSIKVLQCHRRDATTEYASARWHAPAARGLPAPRHELLADLLATAALCSHHITQTWCQRTRSEACLSRMLSPLKLLRGDGIIQPALQRSRVSQSSLHPGHGMVVPQPTVLVYSEAQQSQEVVPSQQDKVYSNGYIPHRPDNADRPLPSATSLHSSDGTLLLSGLTAKYSF